MRTKDYIKEINQYIKQLSVENEEKFSEILLKIRFSDINAHDAEEFSHHCLDIFLQAEKAQIPVETLLNTDDLNSFCNEYIEETKSGYSFFEKLYWRVNTIPMILFIFLGIWEILIGYLIEAWIKKESLFSVPFTLSMLADTLLVIIIVNFLIKKSYYFYTAFNSEDKKKDRFATFLLWFGFCFMTGLFVASKLIFTQVLFYMNYLIFMSVLGGICAFQHIFENRDI